MNDRKAAETRAITRGVLDPFLRLRLLLWIVLLAVAGCSEKKNEARESSFPSNPVGRSQVGGGAYDVLEAALSALATDTIAGFDSNAIQDVRASNSRGPFLLTSNSEYEQYFEELAASPQMDSLRCRIRLDFGRELDSIRNAVVIMAMGSVEPERPPYIAACLYGNDAQAFYWADLEQKTIKRLPLPKSVPVIVDSILSLRPGSVEEKGTHGNRIAFIGIATQHGRYAMIAAPGLSTSGRDYDRDWDFKLDVPRDAFTRRKVVDSLLHVTADIGDPMNWRGAW